jgi:hypothetical protein
MSSKRFTLFKAEYQREKRGAERDRLLPTDRRCPNCSVVCTASRGWVTMPIDQALQRLGTISPALGKLVRSGWIVVCRKCWWKEAAKCKPVDP